MKTLHAVLCGLVVLLGSATVHARAVAPPAPNPGLENAVRGADAIAEVEILAGGPFRAVAAVRRTIKGALPSVIELQGINSIHGNIIQNSYASGKKYILFLSGTGTPGVFAPLTPTTPRMGIEAGGVELVLGEPPFSIPVKPAVLNEAFALLMERDASGAAPERAAAFIREQWEQPDVETRYVAVALAGFLREARSVPLVVQAADDKLLRLRLTAIEALGRIASPEALAALRALLKDERGVVAQEAAAELIGLEHGPALKDLLAWAQRASGEAAKLGQSDTRRTKLLVLIARLLLLADDRGPVFPPEVLCPALLDLAKMKDAEPAVASDALYVYGTLAQAPQIEALIDLADDPVYAQRSLAATALGRATLHSTANIEAFRAWWKDARAGFGEDYRRAVAEAAAKELLSQNDTDLQAALVSMLRMAPPAAALVSAAPVLMDDKLSAVIDGMELNFWRSPLAVPFLVERLGWEDETARRSALDGLTAFAGKHSRLRECARRFARAAQCESNSTIRRYAFRDSGALDDGLAMPALLDALRDPTSYESEDAFRSVYQLSARTLGHGEYEPIVDQEAAARRLNGWWKTLETQSKALAWKPVRILRPNSAPLAADERKELERLLVAPDSRPSAAAFAELFRSCGPEDALWVKLLDAKRTRDRAHGVLGMLGGDGSLAPKLAALLSGEKADADIVRAQAMLVLGSLKGGKGAEAFASWWDADGAKAKLPWRRLALLSLAQADGEPKSLAVLAGVVERVLASELVSAAPPLLLAEEPPAAVSPDRPLLHAALTVLAVRNDATPVLKKALALKSSAMREFALRALVLRRPKGVTELVLTAFKGIDRTDVVDLARLCEPLFEIADAKRLREMLLNGNDSGRLAAAAVFAGRPELAVEDESRAALLEACNDLAATVRARAAQALGKLRHASAVRMLTAMLADTDTEVSASAAEALARIGDLAGCVKAAREASRGFRRDLRWYRAIGIGADEAQLAALLKLTASDIWTDRRAGIDGLSGCEQVEALARLLEIFRDNDSPCRTMAAEALVFQGDAAVAGFAKDLDDAKWQVRAQAVDVIGRIPTRAAAKRLLLALNDPDANVRTLADWGLRKLSGGKEAGFDPLAAAPVREASAKRWPELLPKNLQPD